MKQDNESQYDDDLTVGTDEYDDSYYSDGEDLFDFSTSDESPISRLKSLVLSIDWEITDEVLLQFNEELLDLKGIWAGNSINLVYVQALEKLGKYIYQNKADSHPNAIKLLLTFYYNLEKIVSSQDLPEERKKEILLEDVKRFEGLKRQIKQKTQPVQEPPSARTEPLQVKKAVAGEDQLLNLKAIVLGIDWEITDQDLDDLRREVIRLEEQFAASRPKLILLQGIGTLGAYIKTKKSNAHTDAFKVLLLLYESLEKLVQRPMSLEEEKSILFPVVEKFNSFKSLLGPTISPEAISRKEDDEEDEDYAESVSGEIAPALADIPDEETMGFQADDEAKSLGFEGTGGVASHLDDFFGESLAPAVEEEVDLFSSTESDEISIVGFDDDDAAVLPLVEREVALQGVDVEADDEEEFDQESALAVSVFGGGEEAGVEPGEMSSVEVTEAVLSPPEEEQPKGIIASEEEVARVAESIFSDEETEAPVTVPGYTGVDKNVALRGVDVETEADEDSDELSLPMDGVEFAPALAASEGESIFSAETLESNVASGGISEEIFGTLDDLFLDEVHVPPYVATEKNVEEDIVGEVTREEEIEEWTDELASFLDESAIETDIFAQGEAADEEAAQIPENDGEPEFADAVVEKEDVEVLTRQEQEEDLSLFFTGSDLEQSAEDSAAMDMLFESLEPAIVEEDKEESITSEVNEQIDAIFDLEEIPEEPHGEQVSVVPAEVETATAADMEVSPFAVEQISEEEEVVFELAEEPVEASPVSHEPTDETIATDEPDLGLVVAVAESTAPIFLEAEQDNGVLAFADAEPMSDMREMPSSPLGGLQACIESLGIDLDDRIIIGLFQEINTLRQKWSGMPLEKTFLQLLSTITQHIDQYRFEASSEAHNLLQSVCKALSDRREDDIHHSQELLLMETLKVLEWQQAMLTRQSEQKVAQLTFGAPARTEGADMQGVADTQKVEGDSFLAVEGSRQDQPAIVSSGEGGMDVAMTGESPVGQKTELSREEFAEELKQEIASLRLTLQKEIAELRSELKSM